MLQAGKIKLSNDDVENCDDTFKLSPSNESGSSSSSPVTSAEVSPSHPAVKKVLSLPRLLMCVTAQNKCFAVVLLAM